MTRSTLCLIWAIVIAAIGATNNDGQILISEYDKAWYEFQCKILTVLAVVVVVVAVVEEKDAV